MNETHITVVFKGRCKRILVLNETTYLRLLNMLYEDLKLDPVKENVFMEVHMNVPHLPLLQIESDNDVRFYLQFKMDDGHTNFPLHVSVVGRKEERAPHSPQSSHGSNSV